MEEIQLDSPPEKEEDTRGLRKCSSGSLRGLDVRKYVRQVSGDKKGQREDVWCWTEVFLELVEELEVVRKEGWKVKKTEYADTWEDWVESIQLEAMRMHSIARVIMAEDGDRRREGRKEYRKMKEKMELMRERWRMSELELEVAKKRVG